MNNSPPGCWFCGESPDADSMMIVKLFKDDAEQPFSVPRCADCKHRHTRIESWSGWIGIGAGLVVFVLAVFSVLRSSYHYSPKVIGALTLAAPLALGLLARTVSKILLGKVLLGGRKSSDKAVEYPAVVAALAEGWRETRAATTKS